jgi:hypothetical protein
MRIGWSVGFAGLMLAATGHAMHVNPDGLGQVLVFPYYSVNGGNQTLVSIANRTTHGKAVKLRFLEAMNGREVFDLNIYLAPDDTWSAAVFASSDTGGAQLLSPDWSCTMPALYVPTGVPPYSNERQIASFANSAYVGINDDGGPDLIERSREGYFEVIEMGEVVDDVEHSLNDLSPYGSIGNGGVRLSGTPANCARLQAAWSPGGYWNLDSSTDLRPPGGGLSGYAAIVDALEGTMLAFEPVAIDQFSAIVQHTAPGSPEPNLATAISDPVSGDVDVRFLVYGSVTHETIPASRRVDAVSLLLMQTHLYNEFSSTASIGGASEWLVSFPTRKFHVDDALVQGAARAPFRYTFSRNAEANGATQELPPVRRVPVPGSTPAQAGELFDVRLGNRHARTVSPTCNGEPACPPVNGGPAPIRLPTLPWASNVISFNQPAEGPSRIFGSRLRLDIDTVASGVGSEGWMELILDKQYGSIEPRHLFHPGVSGPTIYFGLPAIGFWALGVSHGALAPGVLANYTTAIPHRGEIKSLVEFGAGASSAQEVVR